MESIYPPENYGASIHFPLKQYFNEFQQILSSEFYNPAIKDENEVTYFLALKDLMGVDVSLDDVYKLSESCSINLLTCEGENIHENTKDFPIDIPKVLSSSMKLPFPYIISDQRNSLEVSKCRIALEKQRTALDLSMTSKRNFHKKMEFPPTLTQDLQPGSDFIISVLIYRPFAFKYFNTKNASDKLRFSHEILALGQNTLAELRDAIICSSDDGLCKEVQSTSDDLKPLADARNIYPSAFIFIDDVFYNDFRAPNAVDYSLPIIEWAKENKIKNFQTERIENVLLNNLTPRFGYPYLFMHQGDCEHLLVFSDARRLSQDDCLDFKCYPHVLILNRKINKMCFLCSVSLAKWICVDSDRLPQNKVFLCTDCCNSYNYIDGEKLIKCKYFVGHLIFNCNSKLPPKRRKVRWFGSERLRTTLNSVKKRLKQSYCVINFRFRKNLFNLVKRNYLGWSRSRTIKPVVHCTREWCNVELRVEHDTITLEIQKKGDDPNELSEGSNLTPILINNPTVVGVENTEEELSANSCNTTATDPGIESSNNFKEIKFLGTLEWSNRETNYLLKKYNKYIVVTGPRKKFRTKKDMWQRIAQDMNNDLNVNRSSFQCENRYKTVLRKWRRTTGKQVKKEEESGDMIQTDEIISNGTLSSSNIASFRQIRPKKENSEPERKKRDLPEVLWEIFKKKEEGRERRHREKMELIRKLLLELNN